ncbi:hypothetical protein GGR92_005254 [Spirosoma lacussanchae]|uniref:hypothetical protein n=1 Tax=Spirosoma lacussanchae TaxID=1884249 RepID=UPI001108FB20|nr:hypothetical protein [Spirosoma lacussanchae]
MKKPFTQASLAGIVADLWRKCNDLEREAAFCRNHNYMIEAQIFDAKAKVLKEAIFEVEQLLN